MSVHVTSWAWKQQVGEAKLVLLKLADNASDDGIAWPNQDTIAEECELHPRTVRRHLQTLRFLGLLDVERDEAKRGRPNKYLLRVTGQVAPKPARLEGKVAGVRGRGGRSLIGRRTTKEPTTANAVVQAGRKRDPLWDTLIAELGEPETRSERGRRNKAVKELRDVGASADEVRLRIARYRQRWPEIEFTATGLVANWTLLGKPAGDARLLSPEDKADARLLRFEQRMAARR